MTTPTTELVPFRGAAMQALSADGKIWAAVRPVCDDLGLSMQGQHRRLRAKAWATINMMLTVGADGKTRELLCIDLDSLPMWLATIEPSRVKPEARDSLVAYQREAARVLRDHFLGRAQAPLVAVASQPPALVDAQLTAINRQLAEMRKTLQALVATRRAEPAPAAPALPAAAQAGAALVGSEEMARLLGLSLARFRGLYRANPLVWASRVELGGRGSGQELRWDPAKVMALLQRRGS